MQKSYVSLPWAGLGPLVEFDFDLVPELELHDVFAA